MFLSIVIPIYNDEKYLRECLDSCLIQDYPHDDYEIICVDDGSTDSTPEILKEYAEHNTNIRVFTKQHGVQYGTGRVIGMDKATGDYIWFVDHDDFIDPHALNILKQAALSDSTVEQVIFPYYEFFNYLNEYERQAYQNGTLTSNDYYLFGHAIWKSIYKLDFLRNNGISPYSQYIIEAKKYWGIDPFRVYGSDQFFVLECRNNASSVKALNCRPLYFYRRNSASESLSSSIEAIKKREEMRFNSSLIYVFFAINEKTQYLIDKSEKGYASTDTTVKLVMSIRTAVEQSSHLNRRNKMRIYQIMKEKGVFFSRTPEKYTFSLTNYIRNMSWKDRLKPIVIFRYYSYLAVGAYWFLILSNKRSIGQQNRKRVELKRKIKNLLLRLIKK